MVRSESVRVFRTITFTLTGRRDKCVKAMLLKLRTISKIFAKTSYNKENVFFLLTVSALQTKTDTFANSVDPNETARYEPSH